eukprot:SAG25_NODE_1118_length_3897_cov_1.834387_5_plen_294_part_00
MYGCSVVSDCQAVRHLTANDTTTPCTEEPCFERFAVNSTHGAAAALEGGTSIECDRVYGSSLPPAIAQNLTSVATLKRMVGFTLQTLIQAGVMDPLEKQPYAQIGLDVVGSEANTALSQETAAQGTVLLRNDDNILPLKLGTVGKPLHIAVIGPMARARREMAGDYWRCLCPATNGSHGVCDTFGHSNNITSWCVTSIEEALLAQAVPQGGVVVSVDEGADMTDPQCGFAVGGGRRCSAAGITSAAQLAASATTDVVVLALGNSEWQNGCVTAAAAAAAGHISRCSLTPVAVL